jgi:predicted nucleic acid-binding protein
VLPDRDLRIVAKRLEAFPLLQPSREDHAAAAELHRRCARRGITAATLDCHIASAALRHRCQVLNVDGDFEHIARIARLRLA